MVEAARLQFAEETLIAHAAGLLPSNFYNQAPSKQHRSCWKAAEFVESHIKRCAARCALRPCMCKTWNVHDTFPNISVNHCVKICTGAAIYIIKGTQVLHGLHTVHPSPDMHRSYDRSACMLETRHTLMYCS